MEQDAGATWLARPKVSWGPAFHQKVAAQEWVAARRRDSTRSPEMKNHTRLWAKASGVHTVSQNNERGLRAKYTDRPGKLSGVHCLKFQSSNFLRVNCSLEISCNSGRSPRPTWRTVILCTEGHLYPAQAFPFLKQKQRKGNISPHLSQDNLLAKFALHIGLYVLGEGELFLLL